MPIDSPHPAYEANITRWKRCRDVYEGEDAVKAAGTDYLPKLGGQDGNEYAAYKTRALFYEAVGRTIEGFVGAIARREPIVKAPASFEPLLQDVTANGISLLEFLKKAATEDLLEGRAGILVDFDEAAGRPYLALYPAESIVNWFDGGKSGVVLFEEVYEQDGADKYKLVCVKQYRELLLEDGAYVVNIWRKNTSATAAQTWVIKETIRPSKRSLTLKEIPFFWITPRGPTPVIEKPPLLGMVNVAISHYRSSADLEHGAHFTGLPTLWASGVQDDGEPIRVGSATVLRFPDPASRCEYAEFKGQGLGALEARLEAKEHMMAVLGAAIIGEPKKGIEAAETARIRSSGETSLLMGVVNSLEEVIEAALSYAARWAGAEQDIEVQINRDFVDIRLTPQEITALLQAWQTGAITIETFLHNLQQGEMLQPNHTVEDEAEAVKKLTPPVLAGQEKPL